MTTGAPSHDWARYSLALSFLASCIGEGMISLKDGSKGSQALIK